MLIFPAPLPPRDETSGAAKATVARFSGSSGEELTPAEQIHDESGHTSGFF